MSMDASEGKVCPYLQSSLSELQDRIAIQTSTLVALLTTTLSVSPSN